MTLSQMNFKESIKKNKVEIILLAVGFSLGIYLNWETANVIIFLILIHVILHPIPSKFFSALGVISLIITALMLGWEREERAEEFAIYAFYFLFLAILMAIFEIRKKEN